MSGKPVLSISEDGSKVIIHEHGPLPAADAALLLSRALALLLGEIARLQDRAPVATPITLIRPADG